MLQEREHHSSDENKSEVARLRQQIDREVESLNLLKYGFAITSNHDAINARMELIGQHFETLKTILPPLEASTILVEAMEKIEHSHTIKATFPTLIQLHDLRLIDLARLACVPLRTIVALQFQFSVPEQLAAHVLDVISELTEIPYTLKNVAIATHQIPDDQTYAHT
jgi:hypothetical protein